MPDIETTTINRTKLSKALRLNVAENKRVALFIDGVEVAGYTVPSGKTLKGQIMIGGVVE